MNDCALKEILKVKFLSFSREEIERIMDEELEKAPEEMDTELIEMCLDILMGEQEKGADEVLTASPAVSEKKVKKINLKKGLLVAAIITLLVTIAVPVGANIFDIDVPENILKVYEEHFRLDLDGENKEGDLDYILYKNDLDHVILPRFLFLDCKITDFKKVGDDFKTQVKFKYSDERQKISGKVALNLLAENVEFLDGETKVNDQYKKVKGIIVNGIDVVVFKDGKNSLIVYTTGGIEYHVELNDVTTEKAIEIASTL